VAAVKILIVEDHPVLQMQLVAHLTELGFEVPEPLDKGEEVLDALHTLKPDVILMDVVMDGMDGFEACRNITTDNDTSKIPIYFVTSKNQKADRVWGELQGGKGMISKPFTPDQIIKAIADV